MSCSRKNSELGRRVFGLCNMKDERNWLGAEGSVLKTTGVLL
jgi:hypothetical protein